MYNYNIYELDNGMYTEHQGYMRGKHNKEG